MSDVTFGASGADHRDTSRSSGGGQHGREEGSAVTMTLTEVWVEQAEEEP